MKEWIIVVLLLLFAAAVLTAAAVRVLHCSPDRRESSCIVLPVSGHVEDLELHVRSLVSRSRKLRGTAIILADFGADGETAEIARRLCREFGAVEYLPPEEIVRRLKESGQNDVSNCNEKNCKSDRIY